MRVEGSLGKMRDGESETGEPDRDDWEESCLLSLSLRGEAIEDPY